MLKKTSVQKQEILASDKFNILSVFVLVQEKYLHICIWMENTSFECKEKIFQIEVIYVLLISWIYAGVLWYNV